MNFDDDVAVVRAVKAGEPRRLRIGSFSQRHPGGSGVGVSDHDRFHLCFLLLYKLCPFPSRRGRERCACPGAATCSAGWAGSSRPWRRPCRVTFASMGKPGCHCRQWLGGPSPRWSDLVMSFAGIATHSVACVAAPARRCSLLPGASGQRAQGRLRFRSTRPTDGTRPSPVTAWPRRCAVSRLVPRGHRGPASGWGGARSGHAWVSTIFLPPARPVTTRVNAAGPSLSARGSGASFKVPAAACSASWTSCAALGST